MAYDATQDDALRQAHAWLVSAHVKHTRALEMLHQASCEIECVLEEHPELEAILSKIDHEAAEAARQRDRLQRVRGAISGLLKAHGGERRSTSSS